MLVADATGESMLALDCEQNCAIPIGIEAAKALSLRFSSALSGLSDDNRFTLALDSESSCPGVQSERLVIATLHFEPI